MLWSNMDEVIQVEVRPGWRDADGRHVAGIAFTLEQGWKTYWRSPGSTGIPPRFTWEGTRNAEGVALHWPTPSAFLTAGYPSLGYTESFVLPLTVQAGEAAGPITLRGTMEIGVCLDICLPVKLDFDAVLPPVGAPDAEIAAALERRPVRGEGDVTCSVRPSDSGVMLTAQIPLGAPLGNTETVAVELREAQDRVWITDTDVVRQGAVLQTATEFMVPGDASVSFDRSALRFTVVGARGAVEYFGCQRD